MACNDANCLRVVQAKELGVRSVIIDGPDSWSQTLQDDKMIEKFIGIDFSDAESVFDKCLAACKKVQKVCSLSLFVCSLVSSIFIGHILVFSPVHSSFPCISSPHFLLALYQSISCLVVPLFISPCMSLFHYSQHNMMSASQCPPGKLAGVSPTQQWTVSLCMQRLADCLSFYHTKTNHPADTVCFLPATLALALRRQHGP